MKNASLILGCLGVVTALAAILGRFTHLNTITLPVIGTHQATSVLLLGNVLLTTAVWLALLLVLREKNKQP